MAHVTHYYIFHIHFRSKVLQDAPAVYGSLQIFYGHKTHAVIYECYGASYLWTERPIRLILINSRGGTIYTSIYKSYSKTIQQQSVLVEISRYIVYARMHYDIFLQLKLICAVHSHIYCVYIVELRC